MPVDHKTVLAYLNRVGLTAPAVSDAAGLRTLHRAHQLTVHRSAICRRCRSG
jgi:hypothetical protein